MKLKSKNISTIRFKGDKKKYLSIKAGENYLIVDPKGKRNNLYLSEDEYQENTKKVKTKIR
jgi:hypothetical protein